MKKTIKKLKGLREAALEFKDDWENFSKEMVVVIDDVIEVLENEENERKFNAGYKKFCQ